MRHEKEGYTSRWYRHFALFALTFWAIQACPSAPPITEPSAEPTVQEPAQVREPSQEPLRPDASTQAEGESPELVAAPAPELLPEPQADLGPVTSFPLQKDQVQRLGPALTHDIASAMWTEQGTSYAIFESFDTDFTKGELFLSSATKGAPFSTPKKLTLSNRAIVASPSVIVWQGVRWLYFIESDGDFTNHTLKRAKIIQGTIQPAEAIDAIQGIDSLLSWPKFYTWKDKVAVAFRNGQNQPMLNKSDDGKRFGTPSLAGPSTGGAMATLGVMVDGTLVYTYQHPAANAAMISFVRLSQDGKGWSPPTKVSAKSNNVHDTTILPRPEGGADLYYIYPKGPVGFVLFRRYVSPTGVLGPEQQLTDSRLGEPSKPEAHRLPDGRILLAWSEISKRAPNGQPSEQIFQLTYLVGDAPQP